MDRTPPKRPLNVPAVVAILGGLAVVSGALWLNDRRDDAEDQTIERHIERKVEAVADGTVVKATASADGKTTISVPGVNVSVSLPSDMVNDKIDLLGFPPYPGTRVISLAINKGSDNGRVKGDLDMRFSVDAPPEKVRDYYAAELRKAGFSVETSSDGVEARRGKMTADLQVEANNAKGADGQLDVRND